MSKPIFYYFKKYSYLLGIFLFIIILTKTNPNTILKDIRNVKIIYLIPIILITLVSLLIKAYCWNYIKRKQGIKYSFKDSFLMYCSGMYFGGITPGSIGEIIKALYLKNDGYSTGKSMVSVILHRLVDLAFLLVFAIISSLFFLQFIHKQILVSMIIIVLLITLFLISLKTGLVKFVIKKIFYILVPEKYQKSWKIDFQDFINDIKAYKPKDYLIIFAITAVFWVFYYVQMYVLALSVNVLNIPFFYLAMTMTVAGLITLIPVSVSGIGTREAALIILFSPFHIAKETIIVFSAIILLMNLFAALIGLICWLIKPIKGVLDKQYG
jgi:glycosyltransferase 2 family protein